MRVVDSTCTQYQQLLEFRSASSFGSDADGLVIQLSDCEVRIVFSQSLPALSEDMCKCNLTLSLIIGR